MPGENGANYSRKVHKKNMGRNRIQSTGVGNLLLVTVGKVLPWA